MAGWNGREGVDYYVHLYAPSLQEMAAPPKFMLAQMDYAGVDVAVLQNVFLYGQLNNYLSEAIRRYPKRSVGQAQVNEGQLDQESQIEELQVGKYPPEIAACEVDHALVV